MSKKNKMGRDFRGGGDRGGGRGGGRGGDRGRGGGGRGGAIFFNI